MKITKNTIISRFLPLAWDVFFLVLIALNMHMEGFNIIVNVEFYPLIYVSIGVTLLLFLVELIFSKRTISKRRGISFILLILLGVTVPFVLHKPELVYTFFVVASGLDLILVVLGILHDSYYTEARLLNLKLPVNQFNKMRKVISRIVAIASLVILFVISFIVFYYNEVSPISLLILFFVGVVLASVGQIISLSISLSPLNRYLKIYEKDLDFDKLEKYVLDLDDPKLHDETKNLLNITLWKYASFTDLEKADYYKSKVLFPKYSDNINKYYEAQFWYAINKGESNLILGQEKELKKAIKPKGLYQAFIIKFKGDTPHYKFKKKMSNLDKLKKELLESPLGCRAECAVNEDINLDESRESSLTMEKFLEVNPEDIFNE